MVIFFAFYFFFFFFNDTATTEIYTLSLHDALPIGIGPEREGLEALARERNIAVDFRNKVSDAELHLAFLTSDVLVLPSIIDARGDTEGLGVALLDAMSYCIPVIASRVGGIPDIIEDGVSGLLVPPADPEALADAIERV